MIKELDIISLTRDIPEHELTKGSRGVVVHCYNDAQGFEVEFMDEMGEISRVLTLQKSDIRLDRTMSTGSSLEKFYGVCADDPIVLND
jgi:Domain of unknown function (DUF4926)